MRKILKYLAIIFVAEVISSSFVGYILLYFRKWKYVNISHLLIFGISIVLLLVLVKKCGIKVLFRIIAILLLAGISFLGIEMIDSHFMFDREITQTILRFCGWENISIGDSESESRVFGLFTIILPGLIVFYTILVLSCKKFLPKFLR